MNELSSTAKELVDAARDEAGLPHDQRARLRARVLSTASAGGASLFGSLFAKAAAAKLLGTPIVAWGALAVTVAGAGAAYTMSHPAASRRAVVIEETAAPRTNLTPAPAKVVADAPAPPAAQETTHAAGEHVLGEDSHPKRARTAEVKAHAAPAADKDVAPPSGGPSPNTEAGFSEDARLLRDVRAALSSGSGERALALLEAREANPSSGVFAEERAAAKIVTLCTLGRPEARAAAARFLSAHGTSPLAERVRRACPH